MPNYDVSKSPTLEAFIEDDESFVLGLMGPFGSGKSVASSTKIIRQSLLQHEDSEGVKRARWLVVRNTYRELNDTTIKTFQDWYPSEQYGHWSSTDYTQYITKPILLNGELTKVNFEIIFRALDTIKDFKKLLSLELTGAWLNEAREIPHVLLKGIVGRVGRYPAVKDGGCVAPMVLMDTNAPDNDSWWYKLFEEKKPRDYRIFKQPSGLSKEAENKDYLPSGYYERMLDSYNEEEQKVYIHGEYGYVQDGKPVYPEYSDNIHCKPCSYVPGWPVYRGWDFGLTPACVFVQVSPEGQKRVFAEIIADNMGADQFSDDVLEYTAKLGIKDDVEIEDVGDPAGQQRAQSDESTCFQVLQGKGISITSGEQTLALRLEAVKKPLRTLINGEPSIIIDPRCKALRKGFQGKYKYKRILVSEEKYRDVPDKNEYSHIHDANQYIFTRITGYQIGGNVDAFTKKLPTMGAGVA